MSDRPLGVMQVCPIIKCNDILLCHRTFYDTVLCGKQYCGLCCMYKITFCGVAYGKVE